MPQARFATAFQKQLCAIGLDSLQIPQCACTITHRHEDIVGIARPLKTHAMRLHLLASEVEAGGVLNRIVPEGLRLVLGVVMGFGRCLGLTFGLCLAFGFTPCQCLSGQHRGRRVTGLLFRVKAALFRLVYQ